MNLPPIIPIIFLILGALAVGASDLARLRRPSLIMFLTTALALVALLPLRDTLPVVQIVSGWQPVSVFTVPISFRIDQTGWIIAVGMLVASLATALTWMAYPGQHRPGPRAVSMLLVAAAIAGVFASNLLTLVLAWGLLDVVFVAALLMRSGPQVGRRAAVAIILNTTSTLCIWIATLLIENDHGSLYWNLLQAGEAPRAWLALAGILRVGLYPFHQWLPVELGQEPDRAVLLFSIPTVAGLALWARIASAHALPDSTLVVVLATFSALIGGLLAWRSRTPRLGLPYASLALASLAVIATTSEQAASTLTAATLNWLFVNVSLFIARGLNRKAPWWSGGAVIAALSVAGLPATLGLVVRLQVIDGLMADNALLLAAVLIAETLVVAAVARLLLAPISGSEPIGLVRSMAFAVAIAAGALPLIGLALSPTLMPALPAIGTLFGSLSAATVLAWVLPWLLAAGLIWRERKAPAATTEAAADAAWQRVVKLDWLNALVAGFVNRMTWLLRGLASLIEGEGGLIWAIVIIVVGVVLTTGALK